MAGGVPFNEPFLTGKEWEYIREAFANQHFSGVGPFTKKVEAYLEKSLGTRRALLTTSCTHALEMAALLLELGPGDEFIVPAFTFVSTPNAFALRGAKAVFADVTADTLCLDPKSLQAKITPRTKAIVPVHYAGIACDMDAILALAGKIPVVEDNAHGLFGKYRGRPLGTLGSMGTQSFHETKNFSCGEGGAILLNDERLVERAEIIREKGTDRSRFLRGMVDKYTWRDLGSSYVMADLLAAVLWAQLEERERIQAHRRRIWTAYARDLAAWADKNGIRLPVVPSYSDNPFHLFYSVFPTNVDRDRFIAHMKSFGINTVFHYLPLHLSPMGKSFGGCEGDLPVTEGVCDRLVRLPLFNGMSELQLEMVLSRAKSFACGAASKAA